MSKFNVLVLSLNLKILKNFATHHIWILSLTALSNSQISFCLKFLVLNTGVIFLCQALKSDFFQSLAIYLNYQYISFIQSCYSNGVICYSPFSGGVLQILESALKWESWEKIIQGNLNLGKELHTFLFLKNFIFHDA